MSLAFGLGRERAVDPSAYKLGAHEPCLSLKPASVEEGAEALRAAAAEKLAVVLWGGGTRLRRTLPARGYDVAIDLSGLSRILEYDPEDLTVTAECGVTLATLATTIAARDFDYVPNQYPKEVGDFRIIGLVDRLLHSFLVELRH